MHKTTVTPSLAQDSGHVVTVIARKAWDAYCDVFLLCSTRLVAAGKEGTTARRLRWVNLAGSSAAPVFLHVAVLRAQQTRRPDLGKRDCASSAFAVV